MQNTKYERLISDLTSSFNAIFIGSWKRRSFSILSLLLGYYLSSQLASFYLDNNLNTIVIASFVVIFFELIIRLRSNINKVKLPMIWICIDNFRIGTTYAIALEAFKLGS